MRTVIAVTARTIATCLFEINQEMSFISLNYHWIVDEYGERSICSPTA